MTTCDTEPAVRGRLRPFSVILGAHPATRDVTSRTWGRWAEHGIATPSGVVKLAARKIGARWFCTPEDLETFLSALNANRAPSAVAS